MRVELNLRKRITSTATMLLLLAVWCLPSASKEGDGKTVSLRWAVGALDAAGSQPTAIVKDTHLPTGTKLKLLVEPMSKGSVYLLLLDSAGELQVLYRKSSTVTKAADGKPTYIPPGSQWFELEKGAGMETFFLLAAVEPLKQLDQLLDSHAPATAVVDEVRRLNKAYRDFARPVERPVMIGGQTRGAQDTAGAIDKLAVEVEAEKFYGKTITIDH